MRTFNKHPQWYNVPLRLSDEQKHDPFIVINDFFESYQLNEVREVFWNWLVEVLSSDHSISSDAHDRNNHVYFYEKIEELVEVVYVLYKRNKKKMQKLQ
jgi:hypothetical protein